MNQSKILIIFPQILILFKMEFPYCMDLHKSKFQFQGSISINLPFPIYAESKIVVY